jgi:prepilin-type N-terminal cleavage/methylation domain-containing protein
MRNQKGFTLIELAIVIVIIGILLGAVLKGQDLIQNARMKKLTNEVRKWEVALWTCNDRLGTFPGDNSSNDGIIDTDPLTDNKCLNNLAQHPTSHTVTLGSYTFYIYAGNDGQTPARNVLVVCGAKDCGTANGDNTYTDFLRNIDIAFDGEDNSTSGVVRAINTAPSVNNNVVTSVTASGSWSTTTRGAVYYFDRLP